MHSNSHNTDRIKICRQAKQALRWGSGWKTSYCRTCPYVVCICISEYVLYVHNPRVQGTFYGLDLKNIWLSGRFPQTLDTPDSAIFQNAKANCSPSWIMKINCRKGEREKLKCTFETAELNERRLKKRRASNRKRKERNTTENDWEGMLNRKHICRRAMIENEMPQEKERRP